MANENETPTENGSENASPTGQENASENAVAFTKPMKVVWSPKADITAHELALCLPMLIKHETWRAMPGDLTLTDGHLRHFTITDPNETTE